MTELIDRRKAIQAVASSAVAALIPVSESTSAQSEPPHVAPGECITASVVVTVVDKWEKNKTSQFPNGFIIPSAVIRKALDDKLFGSVCIRASNHINVKNECDAEIVGHVAGWRFVEFFVGSDGSIVPLKNKCLVADIIVQAKAFIGKAVRLSSFDVYGPDGVCTEIRGVDCVFLTDNPCWPDEKIPEGKYVNIGVCNEGVDVPLK